MFNLRLIIKYLIKSFCIIFFFPITLLIHLSGYRYINVFTERIGHLALEPDIHIKKQLLNKIDKKKWVIFYKKNKVANQYLLKKWKKYFIIIDSSFIELFFKLSTFNGFAAVDIRRYINFGGNKQEAFEIYKLWKDKEPLLKLTAKEIHRGMNILKKMGYKNQNHIVCIHNREKGFSLCDDFIQDYRNCSIDNFIESINYLCKKNIFTIRIGDKSNTPLKIKDSNFIDYANSHYKSEFMDVFLAEKSSFIIGNTSGIACLFSVMGTPCGVTNAIPLTTMWLSSKDLVIPKFLLFNQKFLSFNSILKKNIGYKDANEYKKNNIIIKENQSIDITLLTKEMYRRYISNNYTFSKKQKAFNKNIRENHYCYMSEAHIADLFIKKYNKLF